TEEIGEYDTSAFIDFILKKTGHKDLVIICVSFGCSLHPALIDARPEYNEKIRGAIYFNALVNNIRQEIHMRPPHMGLLVLGDLILRAFEHRGIHEIFPGMVRFKKEFYHGCFPFTNIIIPITRRIENGNFHVPNTFCRQLATAIGGASLKSVQQVFQQYRRGEFAKYYYGREENLKRYGQESPPLFDMSKITSFVAIYYTDGDGFTSAERTEQQTLKSLGGPTYGCLVPAFNHIDFATGETLKYIFPDVNAVLDSLTGYSNDSQKIHSGKCPSMEWVRKLSH
ncbi:hypothetical protein GE061_003939, partial [Apolygus lucorum]